MNKLKKFLRWLTLFLLVTFIVVLFGYCYFSRPIISDTWAKISPDGSIARGVDFWDDEGLEAFQKRTDTDEMSDGLLIINYSEGSCRMMYKAGKITLDVMEEAKTRKHSITYSQPSASYSSDKMIDVMDFCSDGRFEWAHFYEGGGEWWSGTNIWAYDYDSKTKIVSIQGAGQAGKIIKKRHLSEFPRSAQYFEPVADMPYDEQGRKQEAAWLGAMRAKLNLTHPEQESCDFVKMSRWLGIFQYRKLQRL